MFVIATANNIDSLPPELLRKGRFDDIFFIDLPKAKEREQIFNIHIKIKNRDTSQYDIGRLVHHRGYYKGVDETVPLAVTAKEQISALREWARERTRFASSASDQ